MAAVVSLTVSIGAMSEKSDFHLDVPQIIENHSLLWMSKWADGEVIDCEAVDKLFITCGRPIAGLWTANLSYIIIKCPSQAFTETSNST
jgi:hypothetical protein